MAPRSLCTTQPQRVLSVFQGFDGQTGSLPDKGSLQEAESVVEVIDVKVELRLGD